ncbi:MAG: ABC transporter substrate-binding protein [Actinobacteria bacterium]|nr:ABC transporter substrate-binding protein [Actinomycetota bacterium]
MSKFRHRALVSSVLATAALLAAAAQSGVAGASSTRETASTNVITVGTLYAGTGAFATSSLPEYNGLKFWASQVNAQGGMYVAPLKKKVKVKIVAYNDQSDPATATTLYNQLLDQNKVDVFVADFGSVLTAPAITLAKNKKHLLFDVTGSGTSFFSSGANPYVVLTSLPVSAVWPKPVALLIEKLKIKRVAILYCVNDFDQAQAQAIKGFLAKSGIKLVYYQGVPTTQTDYSTLVRSIQATNPDAVLELGYPNNDIAFFKDLQSTGTHFKFVLTPFPGQLPDLFAQDVGPKTLAWTYTYAVPPIMKLNNVNIGMTFTKFASTFTKGKPSQLNFLDVAGYNAGLVVQAAFAHATSMSQAGIRAGVTAVNGKLKTLEGTLRWDNTGAQVGELLPIAQVVPSAKGLSFKIVYPATPEQKSLVNGTPKYPAP